ncbi:MAG: MarR family winged helix-turn-helix transcriptional regulator [Methylophilaceae bacterium]|jgi:DNA-binding MarR family transcriptional regulator
MTNFSNLLLKNQLCFALYSATNAVTRYYRFYLKEFGITYPQYLVMLVIWENENVTASEIAVKLNLDNATITPILKKLQDQKLISKTRDKNDERVVNIKVTKKGLEIEEKIALIQDKVACKTHLPKKDFEELKQRLNELSQIMDISDEDRESLKLILCK